MTPAGRNSRRKRRKSLAVLVIAAAAGILWPLLASAGDETPLNYEPYETMEIKGDYQISAQGELVATETQTGTLQFATPMISRWWSVTAPGDPHVRLVPQIDSVTLDGAPAQYRAGFELSERYFAVTLGGDDDEAIANPAIPAGRHELVIRYRIPGSVFPVTADPSLSQARVSMADPTWAVFLNRVTATLGLPGPAKAAACLSPAEPGKVRDLSCTFTGIGTNSLALEPVAVSGSQGLLLGASMDAPAPAQVKVPWTVAWDPILGRSIPALLTAALLAVLLAILGFLWPRVRQEKPPGAPVTFEPPAGMGPIQTVYCAREFVGRHATAATLTYLAELGLLRIDSAPDRPLKVTRVADETQWKRADVVSRFLAERLKLDAPGDSLEFINRQDVLDQFAHVVAETQIQAQKWSRATGLSRVSRFQLCGSVLWWLSLFAAAFFATGFTGPTIYALPFMAFVIGGFSLTLIGSYDVRTAEGRRQWAHAAGFERFLGTPAGERRMQFAAHNAMRPEYLAYALAFGVIGTWRDVYLTVSGSTLAEAFANAESLDEATAPPP